MWLRGRKLNVRIPEPFAMAVSAVLISSLSCDDMPSEEALMQMTELPGNESQVVFSPIGDQIAFTSDQYGNSDVRLVDVSTGEVHTVAAGSANESDPQWSPDGQSLAYTSDEGGKTSIWLVSLDGTAPHQLTDDLDAASRPRWSPSSEWLAFMSLAKDSRQTWVIRPDGSDLRQLTDDPGDHYPYGWSPDGSYVLVIQFTEDAQNLLGVSVDGGPPIQITSREGEEWWPQWSPKGDKVAFYTTWDDKMTDIWTADVTTKELRQITELPVEDFRPAWSPDGEWIAYSSDRASKSGVWVSSADGTRALALAIHGAAGELPSWSPDGRRLAFSYLTTKEAIHQISLDGSQSEHLNAGASGHAVEAVVSPDGRKIAFESDDVGTEADLFLFDVDTKEQTRLTDEIAYNARPSWSPDGTHLAFERSPGGGPRTTNLAILDLSDNSIQQLTEHGYVRQPVWCNDFIVYMREPSQTTGGIDQLWAISSTGGHPVQLTSTPTDKRTTDCSPDGQLLFTENHGDGLELWQARVEFSETGGRISERLRVGPGNGGRWSSDASKIAFTSDRDGTPDLYVVSAQGGELTRITNTAVRESWPDWLGEQLIYSANLGGRDVWLADFPAILAQSKN